MSYDPKIHHRRSIRLKGYDYSQAGAYFVTIVTQGRVGLFGEVVGGEMRLNRYGEIVQKWWDAVPEHFPNVETGAFGIMPNHAHGIIMICNDCRGTVPVPRDGETPQKDGGTLQKDGETLQMDGGIPQKDGGTPSLRKPTLGQVVAYFKYQSTKEINAINGGPVIKLWQRNYYECIIRNQRELENIWNYIESNPAQWDTDSENPHP